jgi:hypothetical protein
MNRVLLFLILFFPTLLFSVSAQAQGVPVSGMGIDLSSSTDSPNPGQTLTITARSYSIDIDSSTITWTVDGKVVQKDIGATTLDVVAPPLGKKMIVVVSVVTTDKVSIANSLTINSGSVDMVVENNGFIPPFFTGKLPVAYQNTSTIIAVPHLADAKGVEYDPKNLVYVWKKSSRVIEDQSGYGKQSLTLIGDIVPRMANITVTVSTRDSSLKTTGYISVSYGSPSLSFYVDDPLYGPLWNKAVTDSVFIGSEKETSVLAIPYGFNKPISGIGDLVLNWTINGVDHPELSENQSVTLRAPNGSAGSSNIDLDLRNSKQILQSADTGFNAYFSAKSSSAVSDVSF